MESSNVEYVDISEEIEEMDENEENEDETFEVIFKEENKIHDRINPLASPSAGAPALNYGDVNTETTSPGEVKGLIIN